MREWIVTNGLGGYASLTNKNTNNRKYHGLLISSLNPPTQRWVFISNIYDEIQLKNKTIDLQNIKPEYKFDYFPSLTYKIDKETEIKKTIFMQHLKNTTILKYEIKTKKPLKIKHTPVVNSRHIYDVNSQRYLNFQQEKIEHGVVIKPENTDKKLKILLKNSIYYPNFCWEVFYYHKDHERNDSWVDNNAHIGEFIKKIDEKTEYYIVMTLEDEINSNSSKIYEKEMQRKQKILKQSELDKKFKKLVLSSDNFIVNKQNSKSIVAGYHWFSDWGRDTLISLPGLTLVTKRYEEAKQILNEFGKHCKNGLIPNVFGERDSQPAYNTVDASLWYIDRIFQYLKYTDDKDFLKQNWDVLKSIINGYKNGTENNIHMDDDYLISHDPGVTWMDVRIGDYYLTPRHHKAVEIQALWYNALRIMSIFSQILNERDEYFDLSEKVKQSFNKKYDKQYDVIDTKDESLRPNQIFLVSLDHSMIDKNLQEKIVEDIKNNLLTIFGLRTLSTDHSNYKGFYFGDYNKDESYHNGIVWPWLIGPFLKAYVKIYDYDEKNRVDAYNKFLKPMFDVFGDKWDGNIYEIFDGNPVYTPRGCISQAWSVAEILRSWVEDIELIKPKYEKEYRFENKLINNY